MTVGNVQNLGNSLIALKSTKNMIVIHDQLYALFKVVGNVDKHMVLGKFMYI